MRLAGHFETAGNFLHQIEREMDEFGEDAVEADANGEGAFPWFDMDVAGASFDGVEQQVFDKHCRFQRLFRRIPIGDNEEFRSCCLPASGSVMP